VEKIDINNIACDQINIKGHYEFLTATNILAYSTSPTGTYPEEFVLYNFKKQRIAYKFRQELSRGIKTSFNKNYFLFHSTVARGRQNETYSVNRYNKESLPLFKTEAN